MTVTEGGDPVLALPRVHEITSVVLEGEGVRRASISVTFLSAQRMRAMNRRTFGRDRMTDVIAFGLPHAEDLVGDMYICSRAVRRTARSEAVSPEEEEARVLIHGVLHVLGEHHPKGAGRTRSPMWAKQERYVRAVCR